MGSWKVWLKGLLAAAISSAANAVGVLVADPLHFSPAEAGGVRKLGVVVAVSAIVGAALYLKQSPVPNGPSPIEGLRPTGRPQGGKA